MDQDQKPPEKWGTLIEGQAGLGIDPNFDIAGGRPCSVTVTCPTGTTITARGAGDPFISISPANYAAESVSRTSYTLQATYDGVKGPPVYTSSVGFTCSTAPPTGPIRYSETIDVPDNLQRARDLGYISEVTLSSSCGRNDKFIEVTTSGPYPIVKVDVLPHEFTDNGVTYTSEQFIAHVDLSGAPAADNTATVILTLTCDDYPPNNQPG